MRYHIALLVASMTLATGCTGIPQPLSGILDAADDAPLAPANRAAAGESGHANVVTAGDHSTITIMIGPSGDPATEIISRPLKEGEEPGHETLDHDSATEIVSSPLKEGDEPGHEQTPRRDPAAEIVSRPLELPLASLIEHEGLSVDPYRISGTDHLCYGHNVTSSGLDAENTVPVRMCIDLMIDDLRSASYAALDAVGDETWLRIGTRRQGALIELAYLLGPSGLMAFDQFILALQKSDYQRAEQELRDSLLPSQIGASRLDSLTGRLTGG